MKSLLKLMFCFILLFIVQNMFAQRVQTDSIKTKGDIIVPIHSDADLIDEMVNENGKGTIILTKSTGELYIQKPYVKEKKFISMEGKE